MRAAIDRARAPRKAGAACRHPGRPETTSRRLCKAALNAQGAGARQPTSGHTHTHTRTPHILHNSRESAAGNHVARRHRPGPAIHNRAPLRSGVRDSGAPNGSAPHGLTAPASVAGFQDEGVLRSPRGGRTLERGASAPRAHVRRRLTMIWHHSARARLRCGRGSQDPTPPAPGSPAPRAAARHMCTSTASSALIAPRSSAADKPQGRAGRSASSLAPQATAAWGARRRGRSGCPDVPASPATAGDGGGRAAAPADADPAANDPRGRPPPQPALGPGKWCSDSTCLCCVNQKEDRLGSHPP